MYRYSGIQVQVLPPSTEEEWWDRLDYLMSFRQQGRASKSSYAKFNDPQGYRGMFFQFHASCMCYGTVVCLLLFCFTR
ncbi:angiomotin-like isoform X1 [Tachysurus ichikawai]